MFEHRWHILYYEHVPLWLWPAVWWQLWEIDRWTAHFGRQVFVEVEPDGIVYLVWWEGMHDRWDEDTHEKLTWSPGDLKQYLPGRLAKALNQSSWPGFGALSPVHALGEAQSRNPLLLACPQGLARDQTKTSACEDLLPLGLPLAIPIPDAPHVPLTSVFVTRPTQSSWAQREALTRQRVEAGSGQAAPAHEPGSRLSSKTLA